MDFSECRNEISGESGRRNVRENNAGIQFFDKPSIKAFGFALQKTTVKSRESGPMSATLTDSEKGQLQQTIEMFEVITQSQPDDYQSLEILKEAYSKLGREEEALKVSRQLAQAYIQLGQYSSAIMEYESILERHPEDEKVREALAEIESKATGFGGEPDHLSTHGSPNNAADQGEYAPVTEDIGREGLLRLFVDAEIMAPTDFDIYWSAVEQGEETNNLIDYLDHRGVLPIDKSLKLLSEKTRTGYLDLELYDVDAELARRFPKETCYRWQVLPFDKMSKVVLVATTNPFNQQAAGELQAACGLRPVWYLSHPTEINNMLRKVFR